MRVTVNSFGVLKDLFGTAPQVLELPEGATVSGLLQLMAQAYPGFQARGIAVSLNLEFARFDRVLQDGDEIGLLPPVSGGAPTDIVQLTREPIPTDQLIAEAKAAEDGAVLVFDGIVRNNSRGRATQYLDYEAYEEMAEKQMRELAATAHEKFSIRHVTLIHRLGRMDIGQTSVLIIVSSAHRGVAYEASRWLIDTLKATVPIWKREVFVDGAEWAQGEPFPAELGMP